MTGKVPDDTPIKIQRLAKVLDMTSSSSDNEALVAARKAQQMVRSAGHTYGSLFESVAASNDSELRIQLNRERAYNRTLTREIDSLRSKLKNGKGAGAAAETLGLRDRLLSSAPLLTYERKALTKMQTIMSRSRDEFFILWLAARYGLRRSPGT